MVLPEEDKKTRNWRDRTPERRPARPPAIKSPMYARRSRSGTKRLRTPCFILHQALDTPDRFHVVYHAVTHSSPLERLCLVERLQHTSPMVLVEHPFGCEPVELNEPPRHSLLLRVGVAWITVS